MKNYEQHGRALEFTAPAGGVVNGLPYLIGSFFGVAAGNAVAGARFVLEVEGVFNSLPKKTGEAWAEGQALYFDPATGNLTTTAGALKRVAGATVAAAAGDAVGIAKLMPAV